MKLTVVRRRPKAKEAARAARVCLLWTTHHAGRKVLLRWRTRSVRGPTAEISVLPDCSPTNSTSLSPILQSQSDQRHLARCSHKFVASTDFRFIPAQPVRSPVRVRCFHSSLRSPSSGAEPSRNGCVASTVNHHQAFGTPVSTQIAHVPDLR